MSYGWTRASEQLPVEDLGDHRVGDLAQVLVRRPAFPDRHE
jgi:hypothetical protein